MRTFTTLIAALLVVSTANAQAATTTPTPPKVAAATLENFHSRDNNFGLQVVDLPLDVMRAYGHYAATVVAPKAPIDTPLLLVNRPIPDTVETIDWIAFDAKGRAYKWEDKQTFVATFPDYAPGQKDHYYLVDAAGRPLAACTFTPYPVQVENSTGYKLTWNVGSIPLQVFIVTVEGFEPGEEVNFFTKSGEKIKKLTAKATETGRIVTAVAPTAPEKGGWNTIQFDGKKGKIGMRFPWGSQFHDWAKDQVIKAERMHLGDV
ncbi:MAG: hypothetical protein Q8K75_03235 [Chlamydiales bacterium]|nr:hypothetical protein [Chlamydiales bacterium]